jgi:hypothetical protein
MSSKNNIIEQMSFSSDGIIYIFVFGTIIMYVSNNVRNLLLANTGDPF